MWECMSIWGYSCGWGRIGLVGSFSALRFRRTNLNFLSQMEEGGKGIAFIACSRMRSNPLFFPGVHGIFFLFPGKNFEYLIVTSKDVIIKMLQGVIIFLCLEFKIFLHLLILQAIVIMIMI